MQNKLRHDNQRAESPQSQFEHVPPPEGRHKFELRASGGNLGVRTPVYTYQVSFSDLRKNAVGGWDGIVEYSRLIPGRATPACTISSGKKPLSLLANKKGRDLLCREENSAFDALLAERDARGEYRISKGIMSSHVRKALTDLLAETEYKLKREKEVGLLRKVASTVFAPLGFTKAA